MPIDTNTLATIFTSLETALNTFNGDSSTVDADKQKIADLQAKLTTDTKTQQDDGGAAFTLVSQAIQALKDIQSTLPTPPPPPPTPPVVTPPVVTPPVVPEPPPVVPTV